MYRQTVENISKYSAKKILVECDIKSSEKCKGIYEASMCSISKTRERNNGIDICQPCSFFSKSDRSSTRSRLKETAKCQLKISSGCYDEYETTLGAINRSKMINNGKVVCRKCAFRKKMTGNNGTNLKYKYDYNYFDKIDKPEKAWILGWIASDGHVQKDGWGISIQIHEKDIDALEKIRDIVLPDYELKRNLGKGKNQVMFKISSVHIVEQICKHLKIKPGKKSRTVKFPDLDSDELKRMFIRGFFEGDGYVMTRKLNKYPRAGITTGSKEMRDSIQEVVNLKCGNYDSGDLEYNGVNAINFLKWLYIDEQKFCLNRKIKKSKELFE